MRGNDGDKKGGCGRKAVRAETTDPLKPWPFAPSKLPFYHGHEFAYATTELTTVLETDANDPDETDLYGAQAYLYFDDLTCTARRARTPRPRGISSRRRSFPSQRRPRILNHLVFHSSFAPRARDRSHTANNANSVKCAVPDQKRWHALPLEDRL